MAKGSKMSSGKGSFGKPPAKMKPPIKGKSSGSTQSTKKASKRGC